MVPTIKHLTGLYYILAVSLTIALILVHDYLPQRRYSLLPNADSWAFSNDDRERGGNSTANWLADDFSRWHCTLRMGAPGPSCAIGVALSQDPDDWTTGINLSAYDAILVHLDYSGPSSLVRMHMRNFDEQISSKEDYNSPKFNKTNVRVSDLKEPIRIELNEFQLADWWINDYDIPRKWSQATFDKVTSFGLDFGEPAPLGEHYLTIHRLEFVGEYISATAWYLGILNAWMATVLGLGFIRVRQLHLRNQNDNRRLKEVAAYAETMKDRAMDYKEQTQLDSLTGIYNRTGLQSILDNHLRKRSEDEDFSMILLDIDLFKRINDTYGHSAGDEVLKEIGAMLLNSIRELDSAARWGGEEFLIVCPQTNEQNALKMAEKIRLQFKDLRFPKLPKLNISASFGVTSIDIGEDFSQAFSRADSALYKAKNSGRDCCLLAEKKDVTNNK